MTFRNMPQRGLGCAVLAAALLLPLAARADYHMRSPNDIDQNEWEFETNGSTTVDRNPAKSHDSSYTVELGYGFNEWWHSELELDVGRNPGPRQPTQIQGGTWENTIRLTEPGENWADLGFYAEYSHATQRGQPDDVLFGPLIQKDVGRTTHTLNLFLEKEIGPGQDIRGLDFNYAWQSRWNVLRQASPAIEIYGDAGSIDHIGALRTQQLMAGPVAVGRFLVGPLGDLKYEIGYLFGATPATAHGTVRWRLEWEAHF